MKRNKAKKMKAVDSQRLRELKRAKRARRKSKLSREVEGRLRPLLLHVGQLQAEVEMLRRRPENAPVPDLTEDTTEVTVP